MLKEDTNLTAQTDTAPQEETPEPETQVEEISEAQGEAQLVMNLESMIKNHMSSIDRLKEELSKHRDMLNDSLNSDPVFLEHAEEAKKAAKVKNVTKQQILKRPEVAQISEKVKSLSGEIKELSAALSDYLREFQRVSGITELEGEDGEIREIVYTAKLVRKSDKFKK